MSIHKSWLISVLILGCLVAVPAALESQCAYNTAPKYTTGGGFVRITKTLTMSASCMTTAMDAFGCGEAPGDMSATKLIASAFTGSTMSPFCNWQCDCGVGYTNQLIVTDKDDGLPVELMDFGIAELDDGGRGKSPAEETP